MAADDLELAVEEAMPWLPSQVLDEACDIKVLLLILLLHPSINRSIDRLISFKFQVYMRQQQQKPYLHRQRRHDRPLSSPPSDHFALPPVRYCISIAIPMLIRL